MRQGSGKISVLLWNYCHYVDESNNSRTLQKVGGSRHLHDMFEHKPEKRFDLSLSGLRRNIRIQIRRIDREHGSVLDAWLEMGTPEHIKREDLAVLRQKMELESTVQYLSSRSDALTLSCMVQPHGVALPDISENNL